ncbi:hypothetical protein AX14_008298 [Amanita brunnescens Koide BX004]|nr:hypothetical protein AX14_008298 [Amanita brunnescens Koide BX004]
MSPNVSANGNNGPLPQATLPFATPLAVSQAVSHPPATITGTSITLETPLVAVRSVFSPSFTPPVPSSLPSSQQRQVSASRHSSHAGRSGFAYNPPPGPPAPFTAIPSRKNKTSQTSSIQLKLKCAIIPFCPKSSTSSRPTNMFQLTEENRAHLIPCLAKSNLVFEVDDQATAQGETLVAWKFLDDMISFHLTENNITITPPAASGKWLGPGKSR